MNKCVVAKLYNCFVYVKGFSQHNETSTNSYDCNFMSISTQFWKRCLDHLNNIYSCFKVDKVSHKLHAISSLAPFIVTTSM